MTDQPTCPHCGQPMPRPALTLQAPSREWAEETREMLRQLDADRATLARAGLPIDATVQVRTSLAFACRRLTQLRDGMVSGEKET